MRTTLSRRGRKARALLLDRDGTLVYPRHYPSRPEELVLYPGIGHELRALQHAGFRLVVVTNQSGIARGLFGEAELEAMHAHLARELALDGVALDGVYFCPHHPDGRIPELAVRCDCRKPAPGMLLRAARELKLDLARSWMVGDFLGDVEAGNRAGCQTILVDLGTEGPPEGPLRQPTYVARDTLHALRLIASVEGLGTEPAVEAAEMAYWPERWRGQASWRVGEGRPPDAPTNRGRGRCVAATSVRAPVGAGLVPRESPAATVATVAEVTSHQ